MKKYKIVTKHRNFFIEAETIGKAAQIFMDQHPLIRLIAIYPFSTSNAQDTQSKIN